MGTKYELINIDAKERLSFLHLPVGTKGEISGNPASATMVTWYMFKRQGDRISFLADESSPSDANWPFPSVTIKDFRNYKDVTNDILQELIDKGVLEDRGLVYVDDDDPENIYLRRIKNVFVADDYFD